MNTEYHHHACQEQCLSYLKADEKEMVATMFTDSIAACSSLKNLELEELKPPCIFWLRKMDLY